MGDGELILASRSPRFGWSTLRLLLVVVGSALFIYLMVSMTLVGRNGVVSNDLSSYLAPAVALVRGTGAPYVNYFDVKPPGLVFFFVPWIALFGWSMKSLVVLDMLLLAGDLALFFYLLRRVASPLLRDVVYGLAIAAAFGLQLFGAMFLLSETIGSFLFLLALAVALRFRSHPQAFLLVGALCALSGQVKEVWFLTIVPFAVLALLNRPTNRSALACLAAGWVAMLGLLVGGLLAVGALGAYSDVLRYKATAFPLPGLWAASKGVVNTVGSESIALFLLWPIFPIAMGLSVYLRNRALGAGSALRELAGFKHSDVLVSFLTWACLVLGYVWQAKPVTGHSFVMLFFPFVFFTTAGLGYVRYALSNSRPPLRPLAWRGAGALVIALSLIPSTAVLAGLGDRYQEIRASDQVSPLVTLESTASLQRYAVMASHLNGTGCLQVAYGWDAGAAYIYTETNPCSRHFLANLLTDDVVRAEFKRDILTRPPDVIVYETDMAGLDVQSFEKTVFPYSAVLAQCYAATDTPTVFVARRGPVEESRCIGDQLTLAGLGP
jgi:hypothetical protein